MEEIELFIKKVIETKKAAVVAMIIDIEGSSYRKEGAWMLFIDEEEPLGMISGGCLENDLHIQAKQLYCSGKTKLLTYDLSSEDDLGWGRGAGCNGIVHILLRDVDQQFKDALAITYKSLSNDEPVLMIQSMKNFNQYIFSSKQHDPFEFWDQDNDAEWLAAKPFQQIARQQKFGEHTYFIQLIWPKPHLYVIGAGIDARPLVHFASESGFFVHVLDWREKLADLKYFPTAMSVHHSMKSSLLDEIHLSPLDSVIIMTHDFEIDRELVKKLQTTQLLYLGLLGSKERTARLVEHPTKTFIRTPVGLSIGADGPAEIAISIIAELIAVKRGEFP